MNPQIDKYNVQKGNYPLREDLKIVLENEIIHYFTGVIDSDKFIYENLPLYHNFTEIFCEQIGIILFECYTEWNSYPINEDGATVLQDKELDLIISKHIDRILNIIYQ